MLLPHDAVRRTEPVRCLRCFIAFLFALGCVGSAYAAGPQFEAPPIHPVELSADGSTLYVLHQADQRLHIFDLTAGDLPVPVTSVLVGMEPVSVRERATGEVWVVNHLSDSISIIDVSEARVVRTLQVGDEPADVVFAGTPERAFVTISQEDRVAVFDPSDLDAVPVSVPLEQTDPMALAVSPDGASVYVAAFHSFNRTTVIRRPDVVAGGGPPPPNPPMSPDLPPPPRTALIVAHDLTAWRDETGKDWSEYAEYVLSDRDVVRIDASSQTIVESYSGVGTTLFGMAVDSSSGRLFVSNQEAGNQVRFEPNLKSRFAENRVTWIDPVPGSVNPTHLNDHIDYGNPAGTEAERALSLSIPTSIDVASDGSAVYVAAFGSGKVGVLGSDGHVERRIDVGAGPCGVALDEERNQLYVVRRIPGELVVVDLDSDALVPVGLGFDPVSAEIHAGRARFYDGRDSSAHGDLSCATCHVFGDTDHTAWNLGDPEGEFIEGISGAHAGYHPMKGPLMTQSLKGLVDTDPFHWRGDRETLTDFNPTFVNLMGRSDVLSPSAFAEMETFLLSLTYPPNPNLQFDGSLPNPSGGPNATIGAELFVSGGLTDGSVECVECHELPTGEKALVVPAIVLDHDLDQDLVVPHLRNLYEKTGFDRKSPTNTRGFGFNHDGTTDKLFSFFGQRDFTFESAEDKKHVIAYLLAFDTGTQASVGAQWTMDGSNEVKGRPRVETWMAVADSGPLGLIAKGADETGTSRGWVYEAGTWRPDRTEEAPVSLDVLLSLAGPGRELTISAVYPGTETRLGIDRDLDGYFDQNEEDLGSDPGDPSSIPDPADVPGWPSSGPGDVLVQFEPIWPNPAQRVARIGFELARSESVELEIYDVQGRFVRSLSSAGKREAGRHEVAWDLSNTGGTRVPSGLYFARLSVGERVDTRRIVVR